MFDCARYANPLVHRAQIGYCLENLSLGLDIASLQQYHQLVPKNKTHVAESAVSFQKTDLDVSLRGKK